MNEERNQYEEEYKSDLSKLRDMKIKRADQTEINKLQKEMKDEAKQQELTREADVQALVDEERR